MKSDATGVTDPQEPALSSQQPSPTGSPTAEPAGSATPPAEQSATPSASSSGASTSSGKTPDPLRGSRTSGIWGAVIALVVVLILLAIFILQNTQQTEVNYFGWTGTAPVSAALLIAAAGGALIVAAAGMLRILQLRRRVKKDLKSR